MSFPPNFDVTDLNDIDHTIDISEYTVIPVITEDMRQTYIERNSSGVLELSMNSDRFNLAIPMEIYSFEAGPYDDIVNTDFEHFVDITPEPIFEPTVDMREPGFVERFYDNDWVDILPTGPTVGFLVPSSTKFETGDTVYVSQDPGAAVPAYTGTWQVINIAEGKKDINGISHDAVQTDCPIVASTTPVNGGTITWIE